MYELVEEEISMLLWNGDGITRIDRFDVRSLIDYIPPYIKMKMNKEIKTSKGYELNYLRYKDLIELIVLKLDKKTFVDDIESKWNKLKFSNSNKDENYNCVGLDYKTNKKIEQRDNLNLSIKIEEMSPQEIKILNDFAQTYDIKNFCSNLWIYRKEINPDIKSYNNDSYKRVGLKRIHNNCDYSESENEHNASKQEKCVIESRSSDLKSNIIENEIKKENFQIGNEKPKKLSLMEKLQMKVQSSIDKKFKNDAQKQEEKDKEKLENKIFNEEKDK